jgi:hypothetical protein
MRRHLPPTLAATALAGIALALLAAPRSGAGDRHSDVVRVVARVVQATPLDLGEAGRSQGDKLVLTRDLFRDGATVGSDGVECTVVRVVGDASTMQCVGVLSLPRGQVMGRVLVPFPFPPSFAIAVTGGTGAYRNAHGQILAEVLGPTETRLTVPVAL